MQDCASGCIRQCIYLTFDFIQREDLILQMVSVERIVDYCKLPSEATIKTRSVVNWPTEGQISANNVNLIYFDDSPCILKNLTMTINGREKVG